MQHHVLLVEDASLRDEVLYRALIEEGYSVVCINDDTNVPRAMARRGCDLVIVRCQQPLVDGIKVWSRIRAKESAIPILALSAGMKASDQVLCLDSGADDYIGKPYHLEVLLARIRALLRRASFRMARIDMGPLTLNRLKRQAVLEGENLPLTPREYALLEYLVERPGRTVSRSELVREFDTKTSHNSASHVPGDPVATLRKKLGRHANLIETVRGSGYRISNRI